MSGLAGPATALFLRKVRIQAPAMTRSLVDGLSAMQLYSLCHGPHQSQMFNKFSCWATSQFSAFGAFPETHSPAPATPNHPKHIAEGRAQISVFLTESSLFLSLPKTPYYNHLPSVPKISF